MSAIEPLSQREGTALTAILERAGHRLRTRMVEMERRLQAVLAELAAPLSGFASTMVLAGGKRLRPLLVMLAAEQGKAPPGAGTEEALVRAAVAVELLHSATLIHDDLIDGALVRRGHPTVAARAGARAAAATGDALFARAFAELQKNGDLAQLRALSDASLALAAGELMQREDAFRQGVSVARYLQRCELKTAALFEAACRLGVLAATPAEGWRMASALAAFARRVGIAFQLLDDVLDISGERSETGKVRGKDLVEGTVTLPLIVARRNDPALATLDLSRLRRQGQVEAVCQRIAQSGALVEVRAYAITQIEAAKRSLPKALPARQRELLCLVADAVVERSA